LGRADEICLLAAADDGVGKQPGGQQPGARGAGDAAPAAAEGSVGGNEAGRAERFRQLAVVILGDAGSRPVADQDGPRCQRRPDTSIPAKWSGHLAPHPLGQHRAMEDRTKPEGVVDVPTGPPAAEWHRRRARRGLPPVGPGQPPTPSAQHRAQHPGTVSAEDLVTGISGDQGAAAGVLG